MKRLSILNKIVAGVLIISFILPFALNTQTAKAGGLPVFDASNTVQNTISAISNVSQSASTYALQLKEYVLDGLATMLIKQVIRSLTTSIVNWINSGFQGSPAFVQNPGAFFLDVADQITGDFLAKVGGPLTNLCSPFSIDLRIALAFKYHPNVPKRYTCTLGKIIENSTNAVKNASINGFTAGDFKQGGWPAFVSLTTEPQNNVYGAYLQAESELSWRVAQAQSQQRDEISQGKGFLSWRKCKKVGETTTQGSDTAYIDHELGDNSDPTRTESNATVEHVNQIGNNCEIQTPGSVIAGALETQLGSPVRQLELADEINEIVNALFAQLVTQVLQAGLGGVSGSGSQDKNSYINQISADANNSQLIEPIKKELLNTVESPIKLTTEYKANKEASMNVFIKVKTEYEDARTCFDNKLKSNYILPAQKQAIEGYISEINLSINTKVIPVIATLAQGFTSASNRLQTLLDIKTAATNASTTNDLNKPSNDLAYLTQNQLLTNAKDVVDSKTELDETKDKASSLENDARNKLFQCRTMF